MANINPITFVKEARVELGRVVWPKRAEAIKMTVIVIAVSAGIGLFIGALDIIFVKLTELIVKR